MLLAVLSLLSTLGPGAPGTILPQRGDGGALRTVESEEGRFRLQLPDSLPAAARKSRSTVLGPIHEAHYVLEWGEARVSVELYDIPPVAARLLPNGFLLDRAASGLVADMEARELDRAPVERQEHPARVVTYELPGEPAALERALIVLVGIRLYVVAVTAPPGDPLDGGLERVIDSFEIVAQ
jgi:hypothetical protein